MYGIFVNDDGPVKFAEEIVAARKPVETRTRNMLRLLVGKRVAVVQTGRGKVPTIIGHVTIMDNQRKSGSWLDENRDKTLIIKGSKYDNGGAAKWCYFLKDAERCDPFQLPADAVRHGRSWCEF